ncbi:MAG: flippase-like domain-containing protein [candidate division KSB1 bacterium]|nr:flippase-like domain-containing protein [candidate division KSB1 bacterium]MDZ7285721.1 flippase-like domain-containing protein [candidate division KSB1 bacterium]MDZ7305936.1 flippase-like domain-containing protein [candidate division KSB1 bacterium]MDZ7349618.1 flippase-like domain-containing protein [candidate division KSB1 bacterium]MDZ7353206.1 flippase-like domain-containing protein [candidate division KSB1 bacterium]
MKATLSLAVLALLFWKAELPQVAAAFATAHAALWLTAFVLFLVQQVMVTYCWQILLAANGSAPPFRKTLEVHCIGSFFGTFLPTSVAMDVIRAYRLGRHLQRGVDAASSLFVVRVLGFLVIFLLALLVAVPVSRTLSDSRLFWPVLLALAAFAGAVALLLQKHALALIQAGCRRFGWEALAAKLGRLRESILAYRHARSALGGVLALTWLYQILGIVIIYLTGRSLGIELAIWHYFIYIPLITTIALLPVSLAGLGIREGAFVFFFAQAGVAQAQALSLSLLIFAQSLALALLGGIWYVLVKEQAAPVKLEMQPAPGALPRKPV